MITLAPASYCEPGFKHVIEEDDCSLVQLYIIFYVYCVYVYVCMRMYVCVCVYMYVHYANQPYLHSDWSVRHSGPLHHRAEPTV